MKKHAEQPESKAGTDRTENLTRTKVYFFHQNRTRPSGSFKPLIKTDTGRVVDPGSDQVFEA